MTEFIDQKIADPSDSGLIRAVGASITFGLFSIAASERHVSCGVTNSALKETRILS